MNFKKNLFLSYDFFKFMDACLTEFGQVDLWAGQVENIFTGQVNKKVNVGPCTRLPIFQS